MSPVDATTGHRTAVPARCPAPARSRAGRSNLSLLLLFLPASFLLLFAVWQRQRVYESMQGFGEPDEPDRTARSGPVEGWSGRVERGDRPPLVLRLETLHAFGERQAFDAAALAERFRGGDPKAVDEAADRARDPDLVREPIRGEQPWRLRLSVVHPSIHPTREGGVGEDHASEPVAIEDLSKIRIVGLEPIVGGHAERPSVDDGPSDPLRTLLEFPEVALEEGHTCDLIFWGAPPVGEVEVRIPGFRRPGSTAESRAEVVRLSPLARSAGRASESIARLDARDVSEGDEAR